MKKTIRTNNYSYKIRFNNIIAVFKMYVASLANVTGMKCTVIMSTPFFEK